MKNIVKVENNDLLVSIQDIADFSNNDYRSVQRLFSKYKNDFSDLGYVVENSKSGISDFKSHLLNEPQATFLITLMKNNDIVRMFKKSLVLQFYKMRERLCEVNRHQLETAHQEIKTLKYKGMKTYKDGFMSLNKYMKENDIDLTKETAWSMLVKYEIVEHRDVLTSKVFLIDDTFGRQNGDSVIEFNSRSLDLIFKDYIYATPSLF